MYLDLSASRGLLNAINQADGLKAWKSGYFNSTRGLNELPHAVEKLTEITLAGWRFEIASLRGAGCPNLRRMVVWTPDLEGTDEPSFFFDNF